MADKRIVPVVMPKWGLSMKEGKLTGWLVEDGKRINVGETILEVETDKIAGALESTDAGTLRKRDEPAFSWAKQVQSTVNRPREAAVNRALRSSHHVRAAPPSGLFSHRAAHFGPRRDDVGLARLGGCCSRLVVLPARGFRGRGNSRPV